jgi:hypothetical protein
MSELGFVGLSDLQDYGFGPIRKTDATSNADGYHALGGEYGYDNNGNMNSDPSKGGATIAYNYLNLPKTVTFGSDDKVRYVYDATGVKRLKAVVGSTAGNAKTVHYSGPFIYEDNDLKCIDKYPIQPNFFQPS